MNEKRAVQLGWDEVCDIVSAEVENILGLQISCGVNIVEDMAWAVMFHPPRSPLFPHPWQQTCHRPYPYPPIGSTAR